MKNDRPDFCMSVQMQINESIISENKRTRLNNEGPDEKQEILPRPKLGETTRKRRNPQVTRRRVR